MRQPLKTVRSAMLVLPTANIDTDQIVPARFLTTTSRDGLADAAFADWRTRPDSPLADPRAATAQILVAGDNFGCGSSREHAPWALQAFGLRVVVSTSFADIFRSNSLKNGLLPVAVEPDFHARLLAAPWTELTVDLEACTCRHEGAGDGPQEVTFSIDAYERDCLLHGRDDLDQLLQRTAAIEAFEEARA